MLTNSLYVKTFLLSACLIIIIFCDSMISSAQIVSGIISTNTIWDDTSEPYLISDKIQIAEKVTLNILPDVSVQAEDLGFFEVWGNLIADGNRDEMIEFDNISFTGKANSLIQLNYVNLNDANGIRTNGRFSLTNSTAEEKKAWSNPWICLEHITGKAIIENNSFNDMPGSIRVNYSDYEVKIYNNTFNVEKDFVHDDASLNRYFYRMIKISHFAGKTTIKYNNFMNTNLCAIFLEKDKELDAELNYWNTTDEVVIDSMIYDRIDDLNLDNYVDYRPFLTTPSLSGDINGDGELNIADLKLALNLIAGNMTENIRHDFNSSPEDISNDGRIGLEEVLYIMEVVSGN